MGQKELLRGKLMEMVKQGKMTLKSASIELKISYRQGKRLSKAYREGGDAPLFTEMWGKHRTGKLTRKFWERHWYSTGKNCQQQGKTIPPLNNEIGDENFIFLAKWPKKDF